MAADVDEAHRVERIGGIADMVEAGMRLRDEDERDLLAAFRASRAGASLLRGLLRLVQEQWWPAGAVPPQGCDCPKCTLARRIDAAIGGAADGS